MSEAGHAARADLLAVALSRLVEAGDVIGVGLGTPLALVAALLARSRHGDSVHVLAGGALDVDGDIDVWTGGPDRTMGRTPGYVPHFDSMDMAERQAMTLQFLRPAQVDARGNLNTSRIGGRSAPSVRFPGGLATADVPSLLPRIVTYLPDHRTRSLPERVDWVTGAGGASKSGGFSSAGTAFLVTDLAVIGFGGGHARIVSAHPWSNLEEISENTGYRIEGHDDVPTTAPPDREDLAALAALDPRRLRDREVPQRPREQTGVTP